MPVCRSCGRDVPENVGFCGYCGASAAVLDEQGPVAASAPSAYWVCARCSVENESEAAFCYACGATRPDPAPTLMMSPPVLRPSLPDATVRAGPPPGARWACSTCGEVNDPDARFCYFCGVAQAVGGSPAAVNAPFTAAVASSASSQNVPAPGASAPSRASAGDSWGRWLVLAAVLIAVAAVGGAAAFILLRDDGSPAQNGGYTTPTPTSSTSTPVESPTPAGPGQPDVLAFLTELEDLVRQAGQGRHDIAEAAAGTRSGDMSSSAAAALVNGVISNRQDVLKGLGLLDVPADTAAKACWQAFRKAMRHSIDVDYKYLDWVQGSGSEPTAADNAAAGDWKYRFVTEYNALARDFNMRHNWNVEDI